LIDISPGKAFSRSGKRGSIIDRMEAKNLAFYNRVYRGFIDIANRNRKRFVVIKGTLTIEQVQKRILETVNRKLKI
jgi:dTMP kinase